MYCVLYCTVYCSRCYCKACRYVYEGLPRGLFVVMEYIFVFLFSLFFCPSHPPSSLLDLFRCCRKFWARLIFTCKVGKGNFLRGSDITDPKQQQRERKKRGNIKQQK